MQAQQWGLCIFYMETVYMEIGMLRFARREESEDSPWREGRDARGVLKAMDEPKGAMPTLENSDNGHDGGRKRGKRVRSMGLWLAGGGTSLCLAMILLVLMLMLQATGQMPNQPVTSGIPRTGGKLPTADVDYEGLGEMFGDESDGSSDADWVEEADKVIYYAGEARQPSDYPVPYGLTYPRAACFNAALAHCLVLATMDYSITPNSMMEECYEYYNRSTDRVIWPWDTYPMYVPRYGIHMINWKGPECRDIVKYWCSRNMEKGTEKHLFLVGPVCGGSYYPCADASVTKVAENGHCLVMYGYEDGVFWAKDWGFGPKLAYPENGPLDLDRFFYDPAEVNIPDQGGITEIWCDPKDVDKIVGPRRPFVHDAAKFTEWLENGAKMEDYPKSCEYGTPSRKASRRKTSIQAKKSASMRPQAQSSGEGFSVSAESVGQEVPDDAMPILDAARSVPSQGGDGSSMAWVSKVVGLGNRESGGDGIPHAYELYAECCDWNVRSDPDGNTLEPGMVVVAPIASSPVGSEVVSGHAGVYVGDGMVMHDVGRIEEMGIDEFIDGYGQNAPVGWGWASEAGDEPELGDGVSLRGFPVPGFPVSSSPGISRDDILGALEERLAFEYPGSRVTDCQLMGGGTCDSDDGSDGTYDWGSYVVTLDGKTEVGIRVSCNGDGSVRAVASDLIPVNGSLIYDVAEGEYSDSLIGDPTGADRADAEAYYEAMADADRLEGQS